MESNKKALKDSINDFIDQVLSLAIEEDKLDHFLIEISNHNGNLQTDFTLKDRKKVY